MVVDQLNDWAMSAPAMLFYGIVILGVGLRHIVMPDGSLVSIVASPVFQENVAMLLARGAGLVVAAGGLGFIGNALEDMGVY